MRCKKCGNIIDKNTNYCPNCGSIVDKSSGNLFNKIRSNFDAKTIILAVMLPVLICCILVISLRINENKAIEKYKNLVDIYLKDKYQTKFNIKLYSKGHKAREFTMDHSTGRCGKHLTIRQYVFSVNDGKIPEDFYVTVWEDIKNGEYEIREVNGTVNNERKTSYEDQKDSNNKIVKLHPQLDEVVRKRYSNYSIIDEINKSRIKININSSIKTEINDNYQTLIELSKIDCDDISIDIIFDDYTHTSFGERSPNVISNYFKVVDDIDYYCRWYENCSITYGPDTIVTINLPKEYIFKHNVKEYSDLYESLKSYVSYIEEGHSTQTSVHIKFNNKSVVVRTYSTLEKEIGGD